jgi:hypothetical protein
MTDRNALIAIVAAAAALAGAYFYTQSKETARPKGPHIIVPVPSPCPDGKCPWIQPKAD